MSAFLGPIHYWLYNKIQLQQAIVEEVYLLGEQNGLNLADDCNTNFGISPDRPLEEMIDHGNIHGWLQEQVSQVEYKYAYSVTKLLKKNPDTLNQLTSLLFHKGSELAVSLADSDVKATDLFKAITDNLLDGMPCDHANRLLAQSEVEVTWTRNLCVHQSYWDEIGGDINIYYLLRDSWMEGLVGKLGYQLEKVDSVTYTIKAV